MRLLRRYNTGAFNLTEDLIGDAIPPYAILSHTWGPDSEEVTFEDLQHGVGGTKLGYKKIQFCGEQAARDKLDYFWIDTCCIAKSSSSELSEAINSMFQWYQKAEKCYVYLSDVSVGPDSLSQQQSFRESRWFTRGWTLQELLAPSYVEFFSIEGKRLGDRISLMQDIHGITQISIEALRGGPLSQFSIKERLSWAQNRQTKREEDTAYALLGIFNIHMPLLYGEGRRNAYARLLKEIEPSVQMAQEDKECVQHLRLTDPGHDKMRIEDTKGGLLKDSYHWILQNHDFQQWFSNQQSQLLWIKGEPGKGKTMLLCGIINELQKSMDKSDILSYFFCQATDLQLNNATAVLRGLLYLLVTQQPSLISHLREKHDHAGRSLFEDANAWVALSKIFMNMLQDPRLESLYLIIDALDECVTDLAKLLDLVIRTSSFPHRIKWIVSSRNWPNIEEQLDRTEHKARVCLELNANSISAAVTVYIQQKVQKLAERKKYDDKTRDAVLDYLSSNANDTFLWVALVSQNLERLPRWKVLANLSSFPPGLDSIYEQMMQQIRGSDEAELCKQILSLVAIVYRPITLEELATLAERLEDMANDQESLAELVSLCGSFLTVRKGKIYFIHQSAKDFLFTTTFKDIFPSGVEAVHDIIFLQSLQILSRTLKRDMYNLGAFGYSAEQVVQPDPDPLSASGYSLIYWVDHLNDWKLNSSKSSLVGLKEDAIHEFLREKYLYWLEALSLYKSISKGVVSLGKLKTIVQEGGCTAPLRELTLDTHRFVLSHKSAIENSPLQTYVSALLFSPTGSLTRELFLKEEPNWIEIKPVIEENWSSCLQTLEGHRDCITSVVFSHDSAWLASGSDDGTVKVWDTRSGECLQTLEGHRRYVTSVDFSHDSTWLASGSGDNTVKIWDVVKGKCLQTFEDNRDVSTSVAFSHDSAWLVFGSKDHTFKIRGTHSDRRLQASRKYFSAVNSVAWSHDSTWLASGSNDHTVMVWEASSLKFLKTLEGHFGIVTSVTFSHDSSWLASGSNDSMVKIWDVSSGECLRTLEGHTFGVTSVAFSHDSIWLASGSKDGTVKVWDTSSGECLQMLEGHNYAVNSVAFSHDSVWLASGSNDETIKVWDVGTEKRPRRASKGHTGAVTFMAFSPNSAWMASGSNDMMIKVWDTTSGECVQILDGHTDTITSGVFSPDSALLASGSNDDTIKVWDIRSCKCIQTLKGHSFYVTSVAFSHDSVWIASGSNDGTVKVWDTSSGECLQTLEGHNRGVYAVAFSHDSTWLAFGSGSKVKIWDSSIGKCLQTLNGHNHRVDSVAFSHDSVWLASGSFDSVKVWDSCTGDCLRTFTTRIQLSYISFGNTDSHLHTSFGNIHIGALPNTRTPQPTTPQYQGVALKADGIWIAYDEDNLLWLHSEYRPSCTAVSGTMIGIGGGYGRVLIYKFRSTHFEGIGPFLSSN